MSCSFSCLFIVQSQPKKADVKQTHQIQWFLIKIHHNACNWKLCRTLTKNSYAMHTHTHTHLTACYPGLPGRAGTRKVKPIWILLKQETVSGSGISWAICKSAPSSRQITMPAPHHSCFLQAGCPSCSPTNSIKALKANSYAMHTIKITPNLLFEYQCTRGKFIRSPNRIEKIDTVARIE